MDLRQELDEVRADRNEADRIRRAANERLAKLLPIAQKRGMSMQEVADHVGVTRQAIYDIKAGRY